MDTLEKTIDWTPMTDAPPTGLQQLFCAVAVDFSVLSANLSEHFVFLPFHPSAACVWSCFATSGI